MAEPLIDTHCRMTPGELREMGVTSLPAPPGSAGAERVRVRVTFTAPPATVKACGRWLAANGATDRRIAWPKGVDAGESQQA